MTALELIKAEPSGHERLVFIIDDNAAQRVLIGWTFYRPMWIPAFDYKTNKNTTFESAWSGVWNGSNIDYEKIERLSGIPSTVCERIFYRLKMANLVYPDGTISRVASELVSDLMRAKIRGSIKKRTTNG